MSFRRNQCSSCREEVEHVSANQSPGRPSFSTDGPKYTHWLEDANLFFPVAFWNDGSDLLSLSPPLWILKGFLTLGYFAADCQHRIFMYCMMYEGHPKNNESCWISRKPWHVAYWNFTCLRHSPIHTFETKMNAIGWRHSDLRHILDSVRGDTP